MEQDEKDKAQNEIIKKILTPIDENSDSCPEDDYEDEI